MEANNDSNKGFASQNDLEAKVISFTKLAEGVYGFTAEGDPNSGVIIGDDSVMIIDAQATPRLANQVIKKVREVTDKPIKYVVLTHYHAVRVLGASAYEGAEIITSQKTYEMIVERGEQDWASEFQRFPRLFEGHESIPGLTWPTLIFDGKLTVDLGHKRVEVLHVGEGHTKGDSIVWVDGDRVLFAGDLVEYGATPYCGDAQLRKWPKTLDAISKMKPRALVPGRGDALQSEEKSQEAISNTKSFVMMLLDEAEKSMAKQESLGVFYKNVMMTMRPKFGEWVIFDHCMCFNATRAYDEVRGIDHPRIWTDKRDIDMWNELNAAD